MVWIRTVDVWLKLYKFMYTFFATRINGRGEEEEADHYLN